MGIYISNMKKPKKCNECRFCVNGWCYVLQPETEDERKRVTTNYCPLIDIPTPHGALIDMDDFLSEWSELESYRTAMSLCEIIPAEEGET